MQPPPTDHEPEVDPLMLVENLLFWSVWVMGLIGILYGAYRIARGRK